MFLLHHKHHKIEYNTGIWTCFSWIRAHLARWSWRNYIWSLAGNFFIECGWNSLYGTQKCFVFHVINSKSFINMYYNSICSYNFVKIKIKCDKTWCIFYKTSLPIPYAKEVPSPQSVFGCGGVRCAYSMLFTPVRGYSGENWAADATPF